MAECLLAHGLRPLSSHIDQAIKTAAYLFLELYLRYDIEINEPRGHVRDVALSQTFDNEEMTSWFLDHRVDPNAETKDGVTPISIAMVKAPFTIIEMLFDRGGPESITKGVLLWAATSRTLPDSVQVLNYLLAKGASRDLNKLRHHDRPDLAYYADAIFGRETPLHAAAAKGRLDVVKFLVSKGADPMIMSSDAIEAVWKGELAIDTARNQLKIKGRDVGNFVAIIDFLEPLSRSNTTTGFDDHNQNFVGSEKL